MIALDGVPLVIGLVFLRPSLLVLGCAISETIVFVVVHRSPLIRVFFNTASTILSVAVATVVFRELLAGHSPVSLRWWAAIVVAVCTKELLATFNFQVVTRLNGQAPEGRTGSQITTH